MISSAISSPAADSTVSSIYPDLAYRAGDEVRAQADRNVIAVVNVRCAVFPRISKSNTAEVSDRCRTCLAVLRRFG